MRFLNVDRKEAGVNRPVGGHEGDARNGQGDDAEDHEQDAEDPHGISSRVGRWCSILGPDPLARVGGPDVYGSDANAVPLRRERQLEQARAECLWLLASLFEDSGRAT
jgi:hypothetical protein